MIFLITRLGLETLGRTSPHHSSSCTSAGKEASHDLFRSLNFQGCRFCVSLSFLLIGLAWSLSISTHFQLSDILSHVQTTWAPLDPHFTPPPDQPPSPTKHLGPEQPARAIPSSHLVRSVEQRANEDRGSGPDS